MLSIHYLYTILSIQLDILMYILFLRHHTLPQLNTKLSNELLPDLLV